MAFYDIFESLCIEKGVTPTQVARDNGIKQSVVAMWKKRGSTPKAETVQKLADYFGVPIDYLLKDGTIMLDELLRQGELLAQRIENYRLDISPESLTGAPASTITISLDGSMGSGKSAYLHSIKRITGTPQIQVLSAMEKLNPDGQQKAVERVEELTEIPRYRAETAPQSPPSQQVGTDTTPPPDGSEGTQEGE